MDTTIPYFVFFIIFLLVVFLSQCMFCGLGVFCFEQRNRRRQRQQKKQLRVLCQPPLEDDWQCVICLDTNQQEVVALKCMHAYHESCILKWLQNNDHCPICRNNVYTVTQHVWYTMYVYPTLYTCCMLSCTAISKSKFWKANFFVQVPQLFRAKILFLRLQYTIA